MRNKSKLVLTLAMTETEFQKERAKVLGKDSK